MATKEAKKIRDVEYDEIITIQVIEEDPDLSNIFSDEIKIPFKLLKTIAKQSELNPQTKELLHGIFNMVILTKKDLIDKYLRLAKADGKQIKVSAIVENDGAIDGAIEGVNEGANEGASEKYEEPQEPIAKPSKPIKEKTESVRRYGKEKILKDIEAQGGNVTQLQNAMLKLNDLKNIWVNVSARGVKDLTTGTSLLSDEDCRNIVSSVTIIERKLENILKKKR